MSQQSRSAAAFCLRSVAATLVLATLTVAIALATLA
jgi:hypothetical protein